MRLRLWLPAALTALHVASPLAAQAVFSGTVRDDSTSAALAGVEVLVEGSGVKTTTDNAGRFRLEVSPGNRVTLFRLIGFRPYRLRATFAKGDSVDRKVYLIREGAVQLDPLEVTGRPAGLSPIGRGGFEERKRLGIGRFIDSIPLRRAGGRRLSEVLRSVGVRIVLDRSKAYAASPVRGGNCWVNVILDGVTIFRSDRHDQPPDLAQEFRTESLESIEYYRSPAETPIEFGGAHADCGVLVLWTRRG
jgi:hypothetical protein